MSDHWTRCALSDLGRYVNGFAFKPHHWVKEGVPIVRIEQLNNPEGSYDFSSNFVPADNCIDDGDLIFSWSATLKVAIWRHGKSVLNQHLFKVIPHPSTDKGYLFQLLDYHMDELAAGSHGSTMKHIKRSELDKLTVNVPPRNEQILLAKILGALDAQIEATEALIAKQERVRAGLMQDLFTRGVDEHGQLRPPRDQAPHLYHRTKLGWLPLGWEHSPLLKLVPHATYGISDSLSDYASGVPILRMNNIQAGKINANELKYSSKALPRALFLRTGDVLFNRTNSMEHVGKSAIWNGEVEQASFASYLVRLEPDPAQLDPQFLCHWLNRPEVQIEIRRYATPGVHQVNINPTNLRRVDCGHPSDTEEQRAIAELIGKSDAVMESTSMMVAVLKLQKTGLMQDLLTGKVSAAPLLASAVA
jgi:type I restriction enzyme S subunit